MLKSIKSTLRCGVPLGLCLVGGLALAADWPTAGHDLNNSRYQAAETQISAKTVGGLQLKWAFSTAGDVTANPAVDGDTLYFPDSAGFLYAVNKNSGALVWKKPISDYTGIAGDFARATPAVAGNALILGNQSGKFIQMWGQPAPQPAQVFAVDKATGARLWSTQVDDTVMSFVTNSAVVANGTAFVGLASNEEFISGFVSQANGWTWHFRGSTVALDVATGAIKWKTYTVPADYYGGSVWGSTGAIDTARNTLYMASGNNFAVPQSVLDCLNGGGKPATCLDAANHFDSVIAMDMTDGSIKWASRGLPYDAFNVGCGLDIPGFITLPPNDNCPNPKGPDWDFAQGPMLFGGNPKSNAGRMVGAGQKSGMYWAFDAETGALRWSTQAGPPGLTGGLQWGSASDGQRVYVAIANSGLTGSGKSPGVWKLKGGGSTTSGGWAALNANSGAVMWTTADPLGSRAEAAVSAANDVVFGCNLDPYSGTMYALDAKTGKVLWSHDSGPPDYNNNFFSAGCNAGPTIADGMVFWGSGTFSGYGPKKVFAFGL